MKMTKRPLVPESEPKLDQMKTEIADEFGVPQTPNAGNDLGNMPSREAGMMGAVKNAGNVGGEMVRRMIEEKERELANNPNKKL